MGYGKLGGFAVLFWGALIWAVLGFGEIMAEALEDFFDIAWHRYVNRFIGVVPLKSDTTVERSTPINVYSVVLSECIEEMFCMLFSNIFDTEIIDNKSEADGTCCVFPETRGVDDLVIAVFGEPLSQ